jgi:hypothetical protein
LPCPAITAVALGQRFALLATEEGMSFSHSGDLPYAPAVAGAGGQL